MSALPDLILKPSEARLYEALKIAGTKGLSFVEVATACYGERPHDGPRSDTEGVVRRKIANVRTALKEHGLTVRRADVSNFHGGAFIIDHLGTAASAELSEVTSRPGVMTKRVLGTDINGTTGYIPVSLPAISFLQEARTC